jgi:hypothetical protein
MKLLETGFFVSDIQLMSNRYTNTTGRLYEKTTNEKDIKALRIHFALGSDISFV